MLLCGNLQCLHIFARAAGRCTQVMFLLGTLGRISLWILLQAKGVSACAASREFPGCGVHPPFQHGSGFYVISFLMFDVLGLGLQIYHDAIS